jgi:hypothetical protein
MKAVAPICNSKEHVRLRVLLGTLGLLLAVLMLTTSCATLDGGNPAAARTNTSPGFVLFQHNFR